MDSADSVMLLNDKVELVFYCFLLNYSLVVWFHSSQPWDWHPEGLKKKKSSTTQIYSQLIFLFSTMTQ